MVGRPKAADPVLQRNYYLPRSRCDVLERAAAKRGQKATEIVNGLVLDWLDKFEREEKSDAANPG